MNCDDVMLLVAVGVHSRTLSGSEEDQLHAHLASCEACRALPHDTEHDRPRRIVSDKTGRLEIFEVSARRSGPPPTASDVLHQVDASLRWCVANGRVGERP